MLTPSKKRYLLAIYELGHQGGEIFSKDVAALLNIKRPGVSKMMNLLIKDSLILKEPYGKIRLSDTGAHIASRLYADYLVFYTFLYEKFQVAKPDARRDAMICLCSLSGTTVEKAVSLVLEKHAAPETHRI